MNPLLVRPITRLPEQLQVLESESVCDGFKFLTRLITEWNNGTNRFDAQGECLMGVFMQERLIGVGGISRDPFSVASAARLRRMYVSKAFRGQNVGRLLLNQLLEHAAHHFQTVRLYTDTPQAAAFYMGCGFHSMDDEHATHFKHLRND